MRFSGPKSWLFCVICGFLQGVSVLMALSFAISLLVEQRLGLAVFSLLVSISLACTAWGYLAFLRSWYIRLEKAHQLPRSFKAIAKFLAWILDGLTFSI